jgi:hypothetical protein
MMGLKEDAEALAKLNPHDIEISDATLKTPVLAKLALQMAQLHLLEMMKDEGVNGPADKAYQHITAAYDLIKVESVHEH